MNKTLILTLSWVFMSLAFTAQAAENAGNSNQLRAMVFEMNPAEIGITRDNFKHPVWGLLMETGDAGSAFSLMALADGTVNVSYSNGRGIFGAGQHPSVRSAAGHLLVGAQYFHEQATPTTDYPLPRHGEVRFYFLGLDGVSVYSAREEDLLQQREPISNLFLAGQNLLLEVQKINQP